MVKRKAKHTLGKDPKFNKTMKKKVKLATKTKNTLKSKLDYGAMSVDDFMNTALDKINEDSASEQEELHVGNEELETRKADSKLNGHSKNKSKGVGVRAPTVEEESSDSEPEASNAEPEASNPEPEGSNSESENNDSESENAPWVDDEGLDEGNSDNYETEIQSHKQSLNKLKNIDPEFYKFLQDNDKKLLQFNVSDSEDEDVEELHKPSQDLEVASDESDFEDEDKETESDSRVVTLKMLKNWQGALHTDKTNHTIRSVIEAFKAAMLRVSNEEDETSKYKVDGSSVFNAVIQICVLELSPAIRRFLDTKNNKIQPHKCKKFIKIKNLLQSYFENLLKLLSGVTSTSILTVLLKHLHHMSVLLVSFSSVSKQILKKLIYLWGTGDEVVRVLAFLCILRITNNQLTTLLDTVLKSMYMTYIINSKFVSVNTISSINFMRRSLVEMFALDPAVSYKHVFLYIRQLAIHLRNAIMIKKKENIQTVYNWQFINSLKLWGTLLSATAGKAQLQPLIYPFVQVCLGTIKLVPTAEYYPLRFHIVQILIGFSKETGVFVPVLTFILDVLNEFNFNKKHKKVSMKPINFMCLLRVSESQRSENSFKDGTIDCVYGTLLEYLSSQSHSIAFPDLSLFCIFQIKQFLKNCSIASYNKKMKQILEKINENNTFIEAERQNINFTLTDLEKIKIWETIVSNKGTPLTKFYESWSKIQTIKKNKQLTNNDKLGDYNLPMIKKFKKNRQQIQTGPTNPFPSDSEDEDLKIEQEDKTEKPQEVKQQKRKRKIVKKSEVEQVTIINEDNEVDDIVEDLNIDDF